MEISNFYMAQLDEIITKLDELTCKLDRIPKPELTYEERYALRSQIVQLCATRNLMLVDAAAEQKPKTKHFWQR